ncbi:MAG: hypothetical protein MJ252_24845 [archaeon]|nr:hypothetical protein [archaeon]
MSLPITKEKIFFWGSVASLAAIAVTSGYYLFKFIKEEDEEDNELQKAKDLFKMEEDKKELKEEDLFTNGDFSMEGVVKLMIKINKLSEDYYNKNYPNLDKQRRDAMGNDELYFTLCQQTMMYKEISTKAATDELFKNYKNKKLNLDSIQEFISKCDPNKIEEISLKYQNLNDNENNISPEKAKEAYIFYAKTFLEETKKFQAKYSSNKEMNITEEQQAMIMMEFFTIKMKIDDTLFLKYNIDDTKLKIILNKNQLLKDPEIEKYMKELQDIDKELTQKE